MKLRSNLLLALFTIIFIPMAILIMGLLKYSDARLNRILISGIALLVFNSFIFLYRIYIAVVKPLEKLEDATKKIKEGNLDFSLDIEEGDEIGLLCQDFEEMRIRLKENQEEKLKYDRENRELINNISHDLKTPITAIKGYVEGIMDGVASSPEKLDKYIRTIYNKSNDMDRLIDELTFYSKIDTNKMPYSFNTIKVRDFFSDCAEEIGLDVESRGLLFDYSNNVEEDVTVIADVEQLKRVVNNIVSNAIKYMDKSKGRISITLTDDGDFIKAQISDNGCGIDAKDLPSIFDRFYRTDSSRNSSRGGSGIGLSIARKIIEDHGGKIWAKSTKGEGSTILFVLRKYQEVKAL